MKKIYIILMHTNTVPSKLIKFFTRYEYTHVGISLEKDCKKIYSFGRRKFNSIINSGFNIEHKNGQFFHKFNKTVCRIYEIDINNEQYGNLKNILNEMLAHKNAYKYDFVGIILRYFGIPITIKNRYVCSYFVAYVLEKANIYNFNKNVCFIKPQDFENIKSANEIYSGSYKLYNLIKQNSKSKA